MSSAQPSRFARAESAARQLLLLVGLGFLAMVLGTIGSGIMVSLVWQGLQGSGRSWPLIAVHLVSMRMWVWLVLPALAYGAARVLPLRPWRAAAVTVTTGELFSLAFRVAGTGVEGLYRHWLELLLWVATSAAGLWLTARAVEKARAAFALSQTRATAQAQARAAEYAHFRQEAERLAEAHESKPPGGEP